MTNTILSMVKRAIPCLHFISWKPLAFRILVKLIVSGSLPLKQLKRTSGEWVLWFIIAMTLKSGDKAVYELVFFVSLFVLFCFVFFFWPRMYAGRKLMYMPLDWFIKFIYNVCVMAMTLKSADKAVYELVFFVSFVLFCFFFDHACTQVEN